MVIGGVCLAGIGLLFGADGNINMRHFSWNLMDDKGNFSIGENTPEKLAGFSGKTETETISIDQPIQSIETKIGMGQVYLLEGDSFKVTYTYDKGFGKPNVTFSDGQLNIVDKFRRGNENFNLKKWPKRGGDKIEYRIYYPKGSKLESVDINNNLGEVNISDVEAKSLSVKLDAGDIKLQRVNSDEANLYTSIGDIRTEATETNGLDVTTKMGDIHVEGILKGINDLSSSVGDVKIITSLDQELYTVQLNSQIGDIKVNGEDRGGSFSSNGSDASSAVNRINATATTGDIKAIFQ